LDEILVEVESCINTFRERMDSINLVCSIYSLSNIYLSLIDENSSYIGKALAALDETEQLKRVAKVINILIEHQLFTHARANRMASQDDEADKYLRQAHEWLMACADKITTAEYRRSYLEDVPENVAIQTDYQERFTED
jgi:hypothetical protein